jgi:hypothetical protein
MARLLEHVRRQAVGYLALFVALSGTTYAAANLPDHSVTGEQIARRTIAGGNLKTNSVTARAIKRNAVRGSELLESSLGRVPRAGNAAKLGGSTLQQVRAGIDAAMLGGTPRSGFYSAAEVEARLPRAAETRSIGEQTFSSTTALDRITVELTAPRNGFALVLASGDVHPNATVTAAHQCTVEMSVPETLQPGRVVSFSGGDTSQEYHSPASSWIVPVGAGSHVFTLHLSINTNVSTNCNDVFSSGGSTLNAVWLPNAG